MKREVDHYSLQAIIAVGFKIENERAVQFRKWANQIVKDYTIQGWTMDVERLKHGGSVLDNEFFERQLEKVKETYNKFKAIIKVVSDDTTKDLLLNLQKSLEYCMEENIARCPEL